MFAIANSKPDEKLFNRKLIATKKKRIQILKRGKSSINYYIIHSTTEGYCFVCRGLFVK